MNSLFFFWKHASSPTTGDELIISRVIIMAEVIRSRRNSSRAEYASNKLETEASSSFDYRDTAAIVLTVEETAILEASKDYADSAGNLVHAFTTNIGKDRSQ